MNDLDDDLITVFVSSHYQYKTREYRTLNVKCFNLRLMKWAIIFT